MISIHALREEGDQAVLNREIYAQDFNPRPPRGGRLQNAMQVINTAKISIHALREEGDPSDSRKMVL